MLILMMVLILIAAGCVMETTPNIVILAPILYPLAQDRDEPDPVLHHDDHRAGRGLHHAAAGLNLFVVSGITGESILKIAYRAIPFVFFMLIVTLMIAYIPAILHVTSARRLPIGRAFMTREYLKKATLTSRATRQTP
jgi:C4-dicarboxylate transporter DctM subunit